MDEDDDVDSGWDAGDVPSSAPALSSPAPVVSSPAAALSPPVVTPVTSPPPSGSAAKAIAERDRQRAARLAALLSITDDDLSSTNLALDALGEGPPPSTKPAQAATPAPPPAEPAPSPATGAAAPSAASEPAKPAPLGSLDDLEIELPPPSLRRSSLPPVLPATPAPPAVEVAEPAAPSSVAAPSTQPAGTPAQLGKPAPKLSIGKPSGDAKPGGARAALAALAKPSVPPPRKAEPAKAASAKVEPAKVEPAKVEPAKIEPAKVEPAKVEPAKVEPAKVEPAKVEPAKLEPAKLAPRPAPKPAPAKAEPPKPEPDELEAAKAAAEPTVAKAAPVEPEPAKAGEGSRATSAAETTPALGEPRPALADDLLADAFEDSPAPEPGGDLVELSLASSPPAPPAPGSQPGEIDLAATAEAPALATALLAELSLRDHDDGAEPSSGALTVRGGVDSYLIKTASAADEPEPPTRRADDDELVGIRERGTREPPLRLGARATPPPPKGPAPANRPTPAQSMPATTALRFPQGSLRDARTRRRTTKVNLAAIDLALAKGAVPSERGTDTKRSSPELDLHLDGLDFGEVGAPAAPGAARPTPPPPPSPKPAALRLPTTSKPPAAERLGVARGGDAERAPAPASKAPRAGIKGLGGGAGKKTPAAPMQQVGKIGDLHVDVDEVDLSLDELEALHAAEAAGDGGARGIGDLDDPADSAFGRPTPVPEQEDPELTPIRQRFEKGDYLGVLMRAEALLEQRPDFEAARRYLESAQGLLHQMYLERLGSGDQVLRLALGPNEIQGLSLDHRAGFLISLIDGIATVDEILDMSGMPSLDALRLLFEMREQGVIAVDSLARP